MHECGNRQEGWIALKAYRKHHWWSMVVPLLNMNCAKDIPSEFNSNVFWGEGCGHLGWCFVSVACARLPLGLSHQTHCNNLFYYFLCSFFHNFTISFFLHINDTSAQLSTSVSFFCEHMKVPESIQEDPSWILGFQRSFICREYDVWIVYWMSLCMHEDWNLQVH